MTPAFVLTPKCIFRALGGGLLFFLGGHLVVHTAKQFGHERLFGIVRLFDMDRERNLPTLYSTSLFMLSAALFFCVWKAARDEAKSNWIWLVFAGALAFLGIDECCQVHEYLTDIVDEYLGETSGFFLAGWVIPYGIAAILSFCVFMPFIWRQREVRWLLLISGAIFLSGALGTEMISAKYIEVRHYATDGEFNKYTDFGYGLLVAVEESLEMLGLVVLIFTLLRHLSRNYGGVSLRVPEQDDGVE